MFASIFGKSPAQRMREAEERSRAECREQFIRAYRAYLDREYLLRQSVPTDV